MKPSLLFLLMLVCLQSRAQNDNGVIVKFCPLSLIDFVSFPTIQAGVEVRLSTKLAWYNEVGIKYAKSPYENQDSSFVKSGGYKLKSELRYYFRANARGFAKSLYFGANAYLIRDVHNDEIFYRKNDDTTSQGLTDAFDVKKTVFGVNAIFGFQRVLKNHFVLDVYAGVGLRYRIVHTVNEEYNRAQDYLQHAIDINIDDIRRQIDADPISVLTGDLTFGVRLGYRF